MSGWRLDTRCSAERRTGSCIKGRCRATPQRPQERRGEAILKAAVEELVQLIKELKEDGLQLNKVA
jgi:creatinine amidohydrolase/Fe(II)-dependent formamide hydrolase-like protein